MLSHKTIFKTIFFLFFGIQLIQQSSCLLAIRNPATSQIRFIHKEYSNLPPKMAIRKILREIPKKAQAIANPSKPSLKSNDTLHTKTKRLQLRNDLATAYSRLYKLRRAETIWKAILEEEPSFLPSALNLGRFYYLLNRKENVRAVYSKLSQNKKIEQLTLFQIAKELYQEERAEEGILLMETLAESNPKNFLSFSVYVYLAQDQTSQKNRKEAILYYEKAVQSFPNDLYSLCKVGRYYYSIKNFHKAEPYLTQAEGIFTKKPVLSKNQLSLIQSLHKEKKIPSVQEKYQIFYLLADIFYQKRNFPKALKKIKKIPAKYYSFDMLRLYGEILLGIDFSSDLSPLIMQISSQEKKKSLLKEWYGVDDIQGIQTIISSLKSLY